MRNVRQYDTQFCLYFLFTQQRRVTGDTAACLQVIRAFSFLVLLPRALPEGSRKIF